MRRFIKLSWLQYGAILNKYLSVTYSKGELTSAYFDTDL